MLFYVVLPIQFDKTILNINKTIFDSWNDWTLDNTKYKQLNLKIVNTVQNNIKSILIFNKSFSSHLINQKSVMKKTVIFANIC